GDFHHRRHHHSDHGHSEHVHFRRAHGRALHPEHRHRIPGPSQTTQSPAVQKRSMMERGNEKGHHRPCGDGSEPVLSEVEGTRPGRAQLGSSLSWLQTAAGLLLTLTAGAQSAAFPAPAFNAARALQYTREVVAFGPRPIGSPNHKKLENYILAHLKKDQVEDD